MQAHDDEPSSLVVLLRTLQHPVCSRSSSTLEFALQLLECQLKAAHTYLQELGNRLQVRQERCRCWPNRLRYGGWYYWWIRLCR